MANGADGFAHHLIRVACAQIIYATAENVAQKKHLTKNAPKNQPVSASTISMTDGVADALADVAQAFIHKLSTIANKYTEHTRRTSSNASDVLYAIDSLSDTTQSSVRDLVKYAMFTEVPFPYDVPQFPIPQLSNHDSVDFHEGHDETWDDFEMGYIDSWMPRLPSPHTYIVTSPYSSKTDTRLHGDEGAEGRMVEEKAAAQLRDTLSKVNDREALFTAAAAAIPDNPFLAPAKSNSERLSDDNGIEDATEMEEEVLDVDFATDSNRKYVE